MKQLILLLSLLLAVTTVVLPQNQWIQICESSSRTLLGSRLNSVLLDDWGNNAGSQYGNSVKIYSAPIDISDADSLLLAVDSPDSISIENIYVFQWLRYTGSAPTEVDSVFNDTLSIGTSTKTDWLAATYTDTNAVGHLKFLRAPQNLLYSLGKWIQFRFEFTSSGNHYTAGTRGAYTAGTEKVRFYLKKFRKGS